MQTARHSMRTRVGAVMLAGLFAVAVGACGTARIVAKTPVGGTIELEGDHNKAMEQANQEMAEHCGLSNFTVLSEGAEPVDPDGPGGAPPDATRTAYRVRYQCDGGLPVGSAQPPPGS